MKLQLTVGFFVGNGVGYGVGDFDGDFVGDLVGASVMGLHIVYAKQLCPEGHSSAAPLGHCAVHLSLASWYEAPQKKELLSLQGVLPKHVHPGGQSSLPFGHAMLQTSAAWLNVTPQ